MRSALLPSLLRHSFACQAFKHQHLAASRSRLFVAINSGLSNPNNAQAVLTPNVLDSSTSDFADLARSGSVVDKSSTLQDFLRVTTPIDLLLRPRRSGKTTLLRMFRYFFERTSPTERARRKALFIKNNLAITKDARFELELGRYPVLYLDFSDVNSSTMAGMVQKFKSHVTDLALRLEDLGFFQNRGELPKNQLAFLEAVLKGTIPDSEWPKVLFKLTEILHVLHERKVVILIDEYDSPSSYSERHGYSPQANEFFREVFQKLLKNNEHIRGALLVGILRVAKAGWLSGLNNVSVYPLGQTSTYSTACMFTEHETRELYDRQSKIQKLPFSFDDLEKWYNGYSTWDGTRLFNPWSISKALTEREVGRWWNKSGYDATIESRIAELLGSDDGFRAQCQTLLNGGEILINIEETEYSSIPNLSREQLWTLMYFAGYLTTSQISKAGSATVRIPNSEIDFEFRRWIQDDFARRMTPELSGFSVNLFGLMTTGHFAEFAKAFGEFVFTEVPQCIFGSREEVYQQYLYAYFQSASQAIEVTPKWTSRSTMEARAGDGRADVVFYRTVGIVAEFKRIEYRKKEGYRDNERSKLSHLTRHALEQCDTRHYRSIMPEHVKIIYEYGFAFLGPYVGVEARTLKKENGVWVTDSASVYTADEDEVRRERTYCRQYTDGSVATDARKTLGTDIGQRVQDTQDTQRTASAGAPQKSQTFNIKIPNLSRRSGQTVWRDAIRQWEHGDPDKGLPALKDWPKNWYTGEKRLVYRSKRRTRQVIAEEFERLARDDAKFEALYAGKDTLTSLVDAIRRNEENRSKFNLRKYETPTK